MAQVNIAYFAEVRADEKRLFALAARDAAAKEVHGLKKSEIEPNSVSVLVFPVDKAASLSGAEVEVQVLVSGNNWPLDAQGTALTAKEAKVYFDKLAARVHNSLKKVSGRPIFVWITPYVASGWAE